jgi:hypothetical protein
MIQQPVFVRARQAARGALGEVRGATNGSTGGELAP